MQHLAHGTTIPIDRCIRSSLKKIQNFIEFFDYKDIQLLAQAKDDALLDLYYPKPSANELKPTFYDRHPMLMLPETYPSRP